MSKSCISDGWKPKIISMDIAACTRGTPGPYSNTNEFFKEFEWSTSNGIITCCMYRKKGSGYFYYEWLGKLDNGLHVIRTSDNGERSGVFRDLIFLKPFLQ